MPTKVQVIYDTVHTTVFDTVHVIMDSSITVQVLKDSQEFYSWAFGWLLGVLGIVAALFFGIKIYIDKKGVADTVNEATKKVKEEFDERFTKVYALANELHLTTVDLRKTVIDELFTQARLAEKNTPFRVKLFAMALSEIAIHFDKSYMQPAYNAMEFINLLLDDAVKNGIEKSILKAMEMYLAGIEKNVRNMPLSDIPEIANVEKESVKKFINLSAELNSKLKAARESFGEDAD